MWELSCLCNLNSASVCISTKIKSPVISHTILCHTSVHRRDCAEFLLTAFLLCCSASRSCLSHASEMFFGRQFFHKVFFTDFTTTEADCFMGIDYGIFVRSMVYHSSHLAGEEQRCNVINVKDVLYFEVPISRSLRPCFPDGLYHLLLLQQWAQSVPVYRAQGSNQALTDS